MRVNFAFKPSNGEKVEREDSQSSKRIYSLKYISKFSAASRNIGHCDVLNSVQ